MRIKITGKDGMAWFDDHIGEEFTVNSVTVHVVPAPAYTSYEVSLIGRHRDSISGTVPDRHCEVTDWSGWPYAVTP